uniref:Glycosyltransferase n=1 Tax=Linum usitatissimum TaxID=4006 RepID=I2BH69_LINUS|nr:UDP-glycosyltransferase 1 [Linum usitatissimum]
MATFPAQGHVNPSVHFSIQLVALGCRVILVTTVSGSYLITKSNNILPPGLSIVTFSDGYDMAGSSWKSKEDQNKQWEQLNSRGSQFLSDLIVTNANQGTPFACLVYSPLLTWAVDVARDHNLPTTLLWIQPATVMDIYYYLFNGYGDLFEKCKDPSFAMDLPGLHSVSFTSKDLPSFAIHPNQYPLLINGVKQQMQVLTRDGTKSKVLVNTFDELEMEAMKANVELEMIGVGPLIPSCFWEPRHDNNNTDGGDSVVTWLDLQARSSVVYVSFGTMAVISKKQREELAKGLVSSSNRPFLWVIRKDEAVEKEEERIEMVRWREEMETKAESVGGRIIEWCSQVEVLSHEAVGCFVTHCGWNSTLESICLGVPLVAFPQFSDQTTNAKLVEDVWKIGVRVVVPNQKPETEEEEAAVVVEGDEIRRCLDLVMGEGQVREQVTTNADKWKQLARDALREGGSSHSNIKAFVDQIIGK